MNREQKAGLVDDLHVRFKDTPFVVLTEFKGSTVGELDAFRRACDPVGAYFRVVKNTLAVRALEGTGKEILADKFRGNVGLLISGEDAIKTAKLVKEKVKDNEKIFVKAGYFDGDVLDAKAVEKVADLPTKEELVSTLLGQLVQAPQQIFAILQAPARNLLFVLNNYAAKLEQSEPSGGDHESTASPSGKASQP
jgi:large subunit ribosomal protein L10